MATRAPESNFLSQFKILNEKQSNDGNIIALNLILDNNNVTLISLYGPNNYNPDFYENLDSILEEFNNSMCIICGDFNMVLDPKLEYDNYRNTNNPKARNKLLSIIEYRHLIDAYRQIKPDKKPLHSDRNPH